MGLALLAFRQKRGRFEYSALTLGERGYESMETLLPASQPVLNAA